MVPTRCFFMVIAVHVHQAGIQTAAETVLCAYAQDTLKTTSFLVYLEVLALNWLIVLRLHLVFTLIDCPGGFASFSPWLIVLTASPRFHPG